MEAVEGIEVRLLEGSFTVLPALLPAAIDLVSPLTISPSRVEPSQQVTITAIIANAGDELGLTDLILKVRGREVERQTVLVPARDQVSVSFEVRRELEGDYEVEVEATEAVDVTLLEASFTVGRITPPVAQLSWSRRP